ncbi:MAG: protein translocase subunit SecF [Myxococcota bacterium]
MEFFPTRPNFDFIGWMRPMVIFSVSAIAISVAVIATRGFNFGIDFVGGTLIEVKVPESAGAVDEGRVRGILEKLGHGDAAIVRIGEPGERTYRISMLGSQEENRDLSVQIVNGLGEGLGAPVEVKGIESIGPRVGKELRSSALRAILFSWLGIMVYVWFRFEWQYAPGAVLALIHDVTFAAGMFSIFRWEFDMNVLAALLVIIGYSINDTIVIYDRIRETTQTRGTAELESVVNEAINATLSRTILTSGLTQVVVVAILLLGGPVLRGFALALFIGIIVGTYSSIYIASALLIWLSRRYGHPVPAVPKGKAKARATA